MERLLVGRIQALSLQSCQFAHHSYVYLRARYSLKRSTQKMVQRAPLPSKPSTMGLSGTSAMVSWWPLELLFSHAPEVHITIKGMREGWPGVSAHSPSHCSPWSGLDVVGRTDWTLLMNGATCASLLCLRDLADTQDLIGTALMFSM